MIALPVDALIPSILESLRTIPNLVLEAPPGAGKTTRVPAALLGALTGEILVLEPRRLAARLACRRVASELGESPGKTVGYQVRFEQVGGPATRLRFLTEGVLTRRLLSDPELKNVDAVVLDEFHERHLEGDLALALLHRLQRTRRPDLRLIVMSATLHGEPISAFLDGCPVLRSEGRLFDLSVAYTPHSADSLEVQVAEAVERLVKEEDQGGILVFLPGAAEIRRCQRTLQRFADSRSVLLLPLYGDLSPQEQDRAVAPCAQRKVILSTNVAESSITIEGVRAVVDSGLARVAKDNPWTGLARIEIQRVAQASAVQRAGRAGRTGPGRVIRLYTQEDFLRRPIHDTAEVTRRELAQLCLDLHTAGLRDPRSLQWLDAPPEAALTAAEDLLHRLGALDASGAITAFGRRIAALPLHPRLAALALHGGAEGCVAAAALASGNRPQGGQIEEQLLRLVAPKRSHHDPLPQAYLRAFPDRVARRRKSNELLLSGGASAVLLNDKGVETAEFVVALDIEDRPDQGLPIVRQASAIQADWLLDLFPERVTARDTVTWNRAAERVESVSALLYDSLVIEESRGQVSDSEAAAELLASKALEAGVHRFADADAIQAVRNRAAFAGLPNLDLEAALRTLSHGLASFRELEQVTRDGGLERALLQGLGPNAERTLGRMAPESIKLPSGRRAKVQYAPGQSPWVASRLQDFFGMSETPKIGDGTPLVVHLLAPNRRPVQMTQDLAGFWERLYPQVRKELSRRYPRHAWPENPYNVYRD
ncbi:ATP-dependent helicase C-terminal domain-containing protein [uncultured Paludibaculum sp.]|uniref:ATP-dependent RNA helicase n=1 Tax=uncultured Paludibaculum sp. TaxID=1765020 RepID=UPI002AAC066D|nr:ATP-dependent helicase C-terminal domain-containing protein [uncultured Paludibaculum sp.]